VTRAVRALPFALLAAPALVAAPALAAPGIEQIQKEFRTALDKGTPATVCVIAQGSDALCSGVMVSPRGIVLSDFDAGVVVKRRGGAPGWTDQVRVRVPEIRSGTFVEYAGRIVKVLRDCDSTLIRIESPPPGGFKHLVPDTAAALRPGSYTFVAGNSFGVASEGLPSMTAGVLGAVTMLPRERVAAEGRYEHLFTGAAVTPGVSGGPLLDVSGHLVGIVSAWEPVTPDNPYQYFGRAVPIDRLRAAYADVKEAKDVFAQKAPAPLRSEETDALEEVIANAAATAYASVASLVVERSAPLDKRVAGPKGYVDLPRYLGPSSATAISEDGWLVTSLYNLANVVEMRPLGGAPSPELLAAAGLRTITRITARFPDGVSGEAKLVAWHEGLGVALLKADVSGRPTLQPAPASAYEPGRFVVTAANPYGEKPQPTPLVTFGVVSKRHADDDAGPWRGQIQTDAGATDGNCGAAAVDVEGRFLGLLTVWDPMAHGRNSGIGFVIPWDRIEPSLPSMKEGRTFRLPRMGVAWTSKEQPWLDSDAPAKVVDVQAGMAAAAAGMKPLDVIVRIGEREVASIEDVTRALVGLYAGDAVPFVVRRGTEEVRLTVTLGTRD
jgi:S1-C subfamily serine protease